jgi:hypothetical protein
MAAWFPKDARPALQAMLTTAPAPAPRTEIRSSYAL